MQIRAAIARTPNGLFSVEPVELVDPLDHEILVRLVGTGVCHTDVSIVRQLLPVPLPIVLGHEGAGIVEKVGAGVTEINVGDPVVLTYGYCGQCRNCAREHSAYCSHRAALNFKTYRENGSATVAGLNGEHVGAAFFGQSSFANYAITPAINAVKVRPDAPLALLGPLGCGFLTGAGTVMNVLRPPPDATVAVFGAGALGLAAIMAARYLKVQRIVAIDRVSSRLAIAREVGATDLINTSESDITSALLSLGGLDYAIDTTGVPKLVECAVEALKSPGTCVLLAVDAESKLQIDMMRMIPGRTIMGSVQGDANPKALIPKLVDMFMAGDFPIDRLSRFYPFDQINQAVADSLSGVCIKPILTF